MYSNPPMDYSYLTPSSHQWSIPPTYPTNPSFTTPITPSFPSFPWELFSPYYTNPYVPTSSPSLYPNHGYLPHPPNHNPYSSYSSSPYSYYHNNYHQPLQPTNTSSINGHQYQTHFKIRRDSVKSLHVTRLSFKKTLKNKSAYTISCSSLYNENGRNPLPTPQTPSSVVYPYTHRFSRIHFQLKSKKIRSQIFASHLNREAKRYPQFGATEESLSKASTAVFWIGTDVHLYNDPEDVNIAPLLDSKFDFETTNVEKSLLIPEDEEDFKNNQTTCRTVIIDADDVSDEASSIESSQDDLFGEIDKEIALKRKKFVIQGLLKPNPAKEDIADVIHTEFCLLIYCEVGGYYCCLLIYPKGDSQVLSGYNSIYLQIMDPSRTSSSKWDCFSSYCLVFVNVVDDSKTVHHDSWRRFTTKKKSHGWWDFTSASTIFDLKLGWDNNVVQSSALSSLSLASLSVVAGPVSYLLNGIYKTDMPENDQLNMAFVDIGHASMQVCIVGFKQGQLKVLAHMFDKSLGGLGIDYDGSKFADFDIFVTVDRRFLPWAIPLI